MTKSPGNAETPQFSEAYWHEQVIETRERLIFIATSISPARGRYRALEASTGIPAARWQNLFLRRAAPSIDMVMAIVEIQRPYREWILTGTAGDVPGQAEPNRDDWNAYRRYVEVQKESGELKKRFEQPKEPGKPA